MSINVRMVPRTSETLAVFRQIVQAPYEDGPIVKMDDSTARDMSVIWSSLDALATTWRGGRESRFPGMPANRREFWGSFAQENGGCPTVLEKFFGSSRGDGKVAIDLGSGNGIASSFLLERGWQVIAVDSSRAALEVIAMRDTEWIHSGKLTVVEADLTTYTPSEPVDLVVAGDVFPYIDPSKFRATWARVHDLFLKKGGSFVGSLFFVASDRKTFSDLNSMKEMGAWFLPDRRMVRPLLADAGYEIKTCVFRDDDLGKELRMCIEFLAEKK